MWFQHQSNRASLSTQTEEFSVGRRGLLSRLWYGRRRWIALFLLFVLTAVLYWVWWAKEQSIKLPGVVSEVIFSDLTPVLFRDDHLYFSAKNKQDRSFYIFNLTSGQMIEENWTKRYGDNQRTYHLGDGLHLAVENRSILLKGQGWSKPIASGLLPGVKQPISIASNGNALVYATEGEAGVGLYLYLLQQKKSILLEQDLSLKAFDDDDIIQWSDNGDYLLVGGRTIYRVADGERLYTLPGTTGVWSPNRSEVAYVVSDEPAEKYEGMEAAPLGKQVVLFDVKTKKQRVLYEAESEEWVVKGVIWDPDGETCAFGTGKYEHGKIVFEKVHVMDRKLFHFVESEKNLTPSRLSNMRLSKGGHYLSYEMNGILKLINLKSHESRVYDVYFQEKQNEANYIHYDRNGVWLAQNHAILFVAGDMEEKEVYRTPHPLLGFFLSSQSDKLLVIEEVSEGRKLRLINVKDQTKTYKETKAVKTGR